MIPEAVLNEALGQALLNEPRVAAWFFSRTQFAKEVASCDFCRWDNPWSSVQRDAPNVVSGEVASSVRQCETDVLAVFSTSDGRRMALHIENKLASGRFIPNQPEPYQERKNQWKGRNQFGNYTYATTVLIAPSRCRERLGERAAVFDSYISHEDISVHVPAFVLRSA